MSSKFVRELFDARRWSLTARLATFFGTAIAVIVVCVSLMMYAELVHQLHEKEEVELINDMRIEQEVLSGMAKKKVPTHWQNEWREQQEEYQMFAWQLLAADGRRQSASGNAGAFAAGLAPAGPAGHFVRMPAAADRVLLTFDQPAGWPAGAGSVLRGVLDVSQDELVLRRYRTRLVGVALSAVLLSAAIGWLLARRGLAPVRAISTEIGRVNAERLHARIAQESWPSDLRVLAETFDDMMAKIERSFEQLSRFSSDLAHEFRSPINNLVAAASVTLGRARDPAEYQKTLEIVVEEGDRLSRMVSSMLFLARADHAKQQVRYEVVSTGAEFGKLLEFFDIVAEEQGVALQAAGSPVLRADPLLLRRALSNLLANALRYTPRGGAIDLLAEDHGDAIVISVTDNGVGIGAEHLPFLFDRFYRADAARSSADSTGLGLAVVRSIAELHGGSVSVHSTLGAGATFVLRLPKAPAF
ncbi:MAG: heavy metal sensor histidine kinase [Pseudomonadota bacterium]|nr:heavy metal sensor histidine kinase [Pseudomonadota bacterium]